MSIEARRDVFQAIADPTRRQIIAMIAGQQMNLNTIADNFDVSRSAISQHIKILAECGLVYINQKGRERFCEARLEGLNEVISWAEMSRKLWEARFDRMDSLLVELQKKKPGNKK
jgi:DNA-binding transcriptional ArsR family regulator